MEFTNELANKPIKELNTETCMEALESKEDYGIRDQPIKLSTFYKNSIRE